MEYKKSLTVSTSGKETGDKSVDDGCKEKRWNSKAP